MNEQNSVNPINAVLIIVGGFVFVKYIVPLLQLAGDAKKALNDAGTAAGSSVYDATHTNFDKQYLVNSGSGIQLQDGAGVKLESLQKAMYDADKRVFLYQGRLYQLQSDGKNARLATQGTRVTLTLAGKTDTYVQGPYRVQVIVGAV